MRAIGQTDAALESILQDRGLDMLLQSNGTPKDFPMNQVEEESFADETVVLDYTSYRNCIFENCAIVFHGHGSHLKRLKKRRERADYENKVPGLDPELESALEEASSLLSRIDGLSDQQPDY